MLLALQKIDNPAYLVEMFCAECISIYSILFNKHKAAQEVCVFWSRSENALIALIMKNNGKLTGALYYYILHSGLVKLNMG